jgi:peroxiredoxin
MPFRLTSGATNVPLAEIRVRDASGEAVRVGDLVERPTILVLPRYYGCAPCREYLSRVSERLDQVQAVGGAALGISVGTQQQASWLMGERGVRFPLLVDPDRHLNQALDLPRKWWVTLNPRGWWYYLRAIARGGRQGKVVAANQIPGLALLDAEANALWIHRGNGLGDYPDLDQVLSELGALAAPAGRGSVAAP